MEKQNPFSLYDFLGYLVPGTVLISGTLVLRGIAVANDHWFSSIIQQFGFLAKVELYLPFIVLAYSVGHLLSFGSAVTVERFSVWTIGYPSKFLLQDQKPVEPLHKWRVLIVQVAIIPIVFLEWIVRKKIGASDLYAKRLDEAASRALLLKIKDFASKEVGLRDKEFDGTDVFRFVYHYVVEHSAHHLIKLQNYVALYGFLRTLALIAVLFFWIGVFQFVWVLVRGFAWPVIAGWFVLTLGFAVLSFVLYLDFVKFSRRFSLEAFMALSAIYPPKGSE
jgi:hypothetical protein